MAKSKPQPKQQPKKQPKKKVNGSSSRAAPIAQGYRNIRVAFDVRPGNKPGSIRVTGTEYVGRIKSSATSNDSLLSLPLNPSCFPGRLSQYAKLFDKFIFDNLTIHYIAACPSTMPGSVALSYDGDPSDTEPADAAEILALPGAQTKLWQDVSFTVPTLDKSREYFVGLSTDEISSQRFLSQGRLFVSQFVPVPADTESEVGDVIVHYSVTLYEPVLHPQVLPVAAGPTSADGTGYSMPSNAEGTEYKYYPFKNDSYWQSILDSIVTTAGNTFQQYIDGAGKRWLRQIIDARTPPAMTGSCFMAATADALATLRKVVSASLTVYQAQADIDWDVRLFTDEGFGNHRNANPIVTQYQFGKIVTDTDTTATIFGAINVDATHCTSFPGGTIHAFANDPPGMWNLLIAPVLVFTPVSGTFPAGNYTITDDSQRLLIMGSGHLGIADPAPAQLEKNKTQTTK